MSVESMLISILSVSVKALDMPCAVVAEALAPWAWDLKLDDLLSSLHLMCNLRNPNLPKSDVPSSSSGPVQTSIASAWHNVSFPSQTRSCTP